MNLEIEDKITTLKEVDLKKRKVRMHLPFKNMQGITIYWFLSSVNATNGNLVPVAPEYPILKIVMTI